MKLTIKEINRSQAIYKELCELDQEIIKLDKKALHLASNSEPVKLCLTFSDTAKSKAIDQDGSMESDLEHMHNRMFQLMAVPSFLMSGEMRRKNTDTIDANLSDTEALSILGFLINLRKGKRNQLISELSELGFEINQ